MKKLLRIPCVGETVIVHTAEQHNGSFEHPAIVTRVWSDDTINVMVMPDDGTPFAMTSAKRATDGISLDPLQWKWGEVNTWKKAGQDEEQSA